MDKNIPFLIQLLESIQNLKTSEKSNPRFTIEPNLRFSEQTRFLCIVRYYPQKKTEESRRRRKTERKRREKKEGTKSLRKLIIDWKMLCKITTPITLFKMFQTMGAITGMKRSQRRDQRKQNRFEG